MSHYNVSIMIFLFRMLLLLQSRNLDSRKLGEIYDSNTISMIDLQDSQNRTIYMPLSRVDNSYIINVTFSNSNEQFNLQIDTTISWVWVADPVLKDQGFNNTFDCSSTPTCIKTNNLANFSTYFGNCSGYIVKEELIFAVNVQLKDQFILIVNSCNITSGFNPNNLDGGFGLSFKDNVISNSIINNLYQQKHILKKVFSLYLTSNLNYSFASELILGNFDQNYMIGNFIFYLEIFNSSQSSVEIRNCSVATEGISLSQSAIFDSNNNNIEIPENEYQQILDLLSKYDKRCSNTNNSCFCSVYTDIYTFPTLTLSFGKINYEFYVHSHQYLTFTKDKGCSLLLVPKVCNSNDCNWILGFPFLSNFYTVYDFDSKLIGVSPATKLLHMDMTPDEMSLDKKRLPISNLAIIFFAYFFMLYSNYY